MKKLRAEHRRAKWNHVFLAAAYAINSRVGESGYSALARHYGQEPWIPNVLLDDNVALHMSAKDRQNTEMMGLLGFLHKAQRAPEQAVIDKSTRVRGGNGRRAESLLPGVGSIATVMAIPCSVLQAVGLPWAWAKVLGSVPLATPAEGDDVKSSGAVGSDAAPAWA